MPLKIDVELDDNQKKIMKKIPPTTWFTQILYKNAESPKHPSPYHEMRFEMRLKILRDWIKKTVKGKRVLDLFSANGAFSIIAAMEGAKEVVGLEYENERVECAKFIASTINTGCNINFYQGNVYNLTNYFKDSFDVTLCFGGLHHIADPAYILKQIGELTKDRLLLETSHMLSLPFNRAKFIYKDRNRIKLLVKSFLQIIRIKQKTNWQLASADISGGEWYYSKACMRELLSHGGFKLVEERRPPLHQRYKFPWLFALCDSIK